MKQLYFFDSIKIKIPREQIYKRLGYRKLITKILPEQKNKFEQYIDEAMVLLRLKAMATRIPIKDKNKTCITFAGNTVFRSKLFSSLLDNCTQALFMGVTAGNEIIALIQDYKNNDLTRSVVIDALASEAADMCFDWIKNYFNRQLRRENKQLTAKRISCGYADFSIKYQKTIYNILQLRRLGININEKFMLIPEKSATAVMGIEDIL